MVYHPAGENSGEESPAYGGLEVEIVGESVKEVELGVDAKQAALVKEAACFGRGGCGGRI